MKAKCRHCKEVFSITSGEDKEGYFITNEQADKLEFLLTDKNYPMITFLHKECIYGILCPECREITIVRDPIKKEKI